MLGNAKENKQTKVDRVKTLLDQGSGRALCKEWEWGWPGGRHLSRREQVPRPVRLQPLCVIEEGWSSASRRASDKDRGSWVRACGAQPGMWEA